MSDARILHKKAGGSRKVSSLVTAAAEPTPVRDGKLAAAGRDL
jgi:hypothetical protein